MNWPLGNILAKKPYFFCFFISEKFLVAIIVTIFTFLFVEYTKIGWGRSFFVKKLEKEELNIFDVEWSEEFLRETLALLARIFTDGTDSRA